MVSISRRSVLDAVVIALLLAALPRAIYKIIHTGDPYLFTNQFFRDVLARLSGPGKLRFIIQPIVAMILGLRSGFHDAREGRAPFLWALVFHEAQRRQLLRSTFDSIRTLMAFAILLDMVSQFLIFHDVRPGAALIVGPVLITLPYVLTRALANRLARRSGCHAPTSHPS